MKPRVVFTLLVFCIFGSVVALILIPHSNAKAQCGIPDSAGGVTPCPEEEPVRRTPRPTKIPPTSTFTLTLTPTSTSTQTPSFTPSITQTATKVPPSHTATITPTATPTPVQGAAIWMPGIGIGTFILLIIVGIFVPAVQKVRVSRRG